MKLEYIGNVRVYKNEEDNVVAIATSKDDFNHFTNYFCLPHVWDQNANTSWVSEQELQQLIPKSA
jgi:hypothetical protein